VKRREFISLLGGAVEQVSNKLTMNIPSECRTGSIGSIIR